MARWASLRLEEWRTSELLGDEGMDEEIDEKRMRQCSKLAAMRQVQFCTSSVDKIVRKDLF
jgi:hypothetical protein